MMGTESPLARLADAYARQHLTSTILAFKNLLDWSTGDDQLLACSALVRQRATHVKNPTATDSNPAPDSNPATNRDTP
jgi:hypothetical protein